MNLLSISKLNANCVTECVLDCQSLETWTWIHPSQQKTAGGSRLTAWYNRQVAETICCLDSLSYLHSPLSIQSTWDFSFLPFLWRKRSLFACVSTVKTLNYSCNDQATSLLFASLSISIFCSAFTGRHTDLLLYHKQKLLLGNKQDLFSFSSQGCGNVSACFILY